jgi:sporulation protein YlmC with PRC-barrel domain
MSLARCLVLAAAAALGGWALSASAQALQMRLSEILGREVVSSDGERLAIRDLIIDSRTRKVVYLALGRAHGEAKDLILYPVSALRSGIGAELRLGAPEDGASFGQSAPQRELRASQLLGRLVQDAAGKELGRIKDMAVRLADGALDFAVLEGKADGAPLRVPADAFYETLTR